MSELTLPPGWTEERLRNATPDDYDGMAEDDLNRLIAYTQTPGYISALDASHAAQSTAFKSSQRARFDAERAQLGLPPGPNTPPETAAATRTGSQLVEVVVRHEFQADWGFLLFRTDYGDNAAWERYEQEFKRFVDKSLIDDGAESIHDGCMVKMVDDSELQGANVEDVRQHFHTLKEAGEVSPGLDVSMCLVVDKAIIASVTEAQPTPYVLAVDVEYVEDDEDNEEGYQGHFDVANSSLLPDLLPPLWMHSMFPTELWPFADSIFKNASGEAVFSPQSPFLVRPNVSFWFCIACLPIFDSMFISRIVALCTALPFIMAEFQVFQIGLLAMSQVVPFLMGARLLCSHQSRVNNGSGTVQTKMGINAVCPPARERSQNRIAPRSSQLARTIHSPLMGLLTEYNLDVIWVS